MSGGQTDLAAMLKGLTAIRQAGTWRFIQQDAAPDLSLAVMAFREGETWTAIVPACEDTPAADCWAWLQLSVTSSLSAVGLSATVSRALAEIACPCNIVAGYAHDHLFVPQHLAKRAAAAIDALGVA